MKLKTLKDIAEVDFNNPLAGTCSVVKLRELAVDWIKETKRYQGDFSCGTAKDWIKHFFNITEADLK